MDVDALIDPELAPMVAAMPALDALTVDILPLIRSGGVGGAPALSDEVTRTDVVLPDDPQVTVRVHRPAGSTGLLPCLYSIHGGGYIMGSRDMDDERMDRWCPALGMVGVSVEYRLAPETPYPGPLEDCYAGLRWVHDHADTLGVDRTRIGIAGGSAGGGLAAGLALLARDRGEIPVAFQMLVYPMVDDRRTTFSSREPAPVWSPSANEFGWRCYLGDLFDTDDVPAYAAASRAVDLAGLPPAFVSVGTLDGFLDEDVDYAQRLNHAGVPTELHVYPGAPHGFDMLMPGAGVSAQCRRDMTDWLARQFATAGR
jgi:acetyl esterase/lipase